MILLDLFISAFMTLRNVSSEDYDTDLIFISQETNKWTSLGLAILFLVVTTVLVSLMVCHIKR